VDARDWDRRWTDKLLHAHSDPSSVVLAALEGLAPGQALDLGCGNGRHAMWLAERG
jgi:trans-aconitate methyltransferase